MISYYLNSGFNPQLPRDVTENYDYAIYGGPIYKQTITIEYNNTIQNVIKDFGISSHDKPIIKGDFCYYLITDEELSLIKLSCSDYNLVDFLTRDDMVCLQVFKL